MTEPFEDIYIAKEPAQRRALTSPLRIEIIEHFGDESLAVADLAVRMGRRPDSLYYHVRTLVDVGLLLPAGTRKSGKRDEVLYKLIAPAIGMGGEEDDPTLIEDALKTLAASFRMSERELRDAFESRRLRPTGDERNNLCVRQRCRLRPAALKQVNRHLNAMIKIMDREFQRAPYSDDATEHCSFTLAMIPLAGPNEDR